MTRRLLALAALLLLVATACGGGTDRRDLTPTDEGGGDGEGETIGVPEVFTLTSEAFADGEAIPAAYSCDQDEGTVHPPLAWTGVPSGTVELAITLLDPDAGDFVHWVAWGIVPSADGLAEGEAAPEESANDAGTTGYFGPCPPEPHTYEFTVHALSAAVQADPGGDPREALASIEAAGAIDSAVLSGVYPG